VVIFKNSIEGMNMAIRETRIKLKNEKRKVADQLTEIFFCLDEIIHCVLSTNTQYEVKNSLQNGKIVSIVRKFYNLFKRL
jgi:hypothetical protein